MNHSDGQNRRNGTKQAGLVGAFIRKKRETLGLSQRALGQLFSPPVTTQFISNVERGVTPLPPTHVPTLIRALQVSETQMRSLLEREYTLKLSERLGTPDNSLTLHVRPEHFELFSQIYLAYCSATEPERNQFVKSCTTTLKLSHG